MTTEKQTSPALSIVLWGVQGLLAVTFIWAGFMKLFHPGSLPFPWVKDNQTLVLFTGILDLLGGIGIIFPAMLGIKPKLTIMAAYGIIILMVVACMFHISRGEAKDIGFNVVMALLAAFIIWGRRTK